MKRDLDLVIKLLQYFENRDSISADQEVEIEGYEKHVVDYHLRRMYEGGLLDAEAICSSTTATRVIDVIPFGLSWEGHEFLDAAKNDAVVEKAKRKVGDKLTSLPFSILKELLWSILRSELGIP